MSGCRSYSGRLFHSIGPAVAKQRSSNWLCDLLTKHVRLSADRRRRRPAVVTSVHSSARYTEVEPANERYTRVDILKSTRLQTILVLPVACTRGSPFIYDQYLETNAFPCRIHWFNVSQMVSCQVICG